MSNRLVAGLKCLWRFNRTVVLILTPILLLPLVIAWPEKPGRCAYAIGIMAIYWMTEALPIAATALLPIVLFPWLGVLGSKDICPNYLKDVTFLFFGGLLVAVAVEKWNLHKRVALRVLLMVGSKPMFLMLGFMSVTAFLSMWLSNTATTAMMMPIAQAVINEIHDSMKANARAAEEDELNSPLNEKGGESLQMKANGETASKKDGSLDGDPEEAAAESILIENNHGRRKFVRKDSESVEPKDFVRRDSVCSRTLKEIKAEKAYKKFAVGLKLSIALAANIGGTGTLTGTGPNLVIKGQLDTIYGPDNDVNFTTWFVFAFPNMCISLIVGWAWLVMLYISPKDLIMCCKQKGDPGAASAIKTEYEKLGPMSFAEGAVLIHFIVLALAWFSRDPQVFPGWSELLVESGYVTDACVGMTIAMSLFFCPCRPPMFMRCPAVSTCCKSDGYEDETDDGMYKPVPALLDWEDVHKHMAWGVIMILGGSFALADACSASGLSAYMGMILGNWEGVPLWALVIVLCFITTVFTNIISNTATATIFLPILAEMANGMHVNPLYLMIPVAIAASFAFMLPVATPPNAIVFAYGGVRIIDMVISGTLMNIICILLLQVSLNTYGIPLFNLNEFPEWASRGQIQELAINATTPSAFSYNVTLGN